MALDLYTEFQNLYTFPNKTYSLFSNSSHNASSSRDLVPMRIRKRTRTL